MNPVDILVFLIMSVTFVLSMLRMIKQKKLDWLFEWGLAMGTLLVVFR